MKRFIPVILAAAAIICACGRECTSMQDPVTVFFKLDTIATKGLAVDADCISDCCVMVYNSSGQLVVGEYSPDGAVSSMSYQFTRGSEYVFYYVCNIGDITGDSRFSSETALASFQYRISDYSGIVNDDGAVPMSGKSGSVKVEDGLNVSISLTRCVALISIQIDDSSLNKASMSINSMKIKNTPSKVSLFSNSQADSSNDCFCDGDYADSDEISLLNSGGTVNFYMFENSQGELLPDNSSDQTKYFSDGSPNEDKCSYIEFSGSYLKDSGTIMKGTFCYRFYLGGDTTTDFSVCRNVHYVINISLTDNCVFQSSWRIDSDISILTISSLNIYPTSYTFDGLGGCTYLNAYTSPASSYMSDVIWTSSDPSVVTVDDEGMITATGYGTANVTATLKEFSRFSAVCPVTVNDNTVEPEDPPAENPIVEIFTEYSEYTVAMDSSITIDTYLRREDGTVEPISCQLKYDVTSKGTGFFSCTTNNVITGEGKGDATMYFNYEGFTSESVTIHII